VLGLGLDEPVSESTLDALIGLYESQGLALALELVPMARTPELKALLRARRIRAGAQTAVLQRRLPAPTLDAGTLRAAPASPADQQTVADICAIVFEMPPPIREVLAALGSTPGWTPWLAWLDDKPVAAALAYREGDRCWLGWDATLPPYRGRGAKGALDRARVNSAIEAGCRFVSTETDVDTPQRPDPSFRSFRRIGFELAYERATCFRVRGA
jgi:hypothetical protein